jgi:hypothetical protein
MAKQILRRFHSTLCVSAAVALCAGLLAACGAGSSSGSAPAVAGKAQARIQHSAPHRAQKAAVVAADYQDAVQELYIAYFGRPADPNGLANFEAALLAANAPTDLQDLTQAYSTNAGVKSLIDSFETSNESLTLYGGSSTTAFVQAVFQNVLGRQPAQSGLQFWVDAIDGGTLTQGDAALSIMAGGTTNTTSQGLIDAQLIANRITVASYFTAQLSALGDTSSYSGKSAAQAARTMLAGVDSTTTETAYQSAVATSITGLVASGSLGGIAASGAPMANATVTLKDSAGNVRTATTGSGGSFSIALSGLSPPFLLSVTSGGVTWYSYAGAMNATANLNAYTSVLLQGFYLAAGTDVATVFNGGVSSTTDFPSQAQLALLVAPVQSNLQPFLANAGVANAAQFNPFTATFSANGSGFDQVLDRTTTPTALNGYTVDNGSGSTAGSLQSTVTLVATAGSGSTGAVVGFTSVTTDGSSTSTAQVNVPVAASTLEQSDLAAAESGVLAMLQALGQLGANGNTVTAASVLPYIDPAFLNNGQTQSSFAAQAAGYAEALEGATITVYRVNKFTDGSTKYLDVTLQIVTANGQLNYLDDNDNPNVGMVFKQASGGSWVFYGQQNPADAHVKLQQQRCYGCAPQVTNLLQMEAQVNAASGAFSAASISGPANSLPDCSMNPSPFTQSAVALVKDAGSYNGGDRFDLPCSATDGGALAGSPPNAGTEYTFSLTPTGGAPEQVNYVLNAATNDNGDISTFNGVDRATFVSGHTVSQVAGTTLTISFTAPTTYQVLYSYLSAFCANASELGNGLGNGGGEDVEGTLGDIPPDVTSGTIAIPATCDGAPTAGLGVSVWFVGANGESSSVVQNF